MTDEQRERLRIGLEQEASRAALRIRENFRATQPKPCTRFYNASAMEWVAKLIEEANEVVQEVHIVSQLADNKALGALHQDAKKRLALELTDVITVCTSWLHAEGYDEEARGTLQKMVNEKNEARGYCR